MHAVVAIRKTMSPSQQEQIDTLLMERLAETRSESNADNIPDHLFEEIRYGQAFALSTLLGLPSVEG